jgi:hypothetical protein
MWRRFSNLRVRATFQSPDGMAGYKPAPVDALMCVYGWRSTLSLNLRICRQVLECGDGVREVTALAAAALKIPKRTADTATLTPKW